MIFVPPLWGDIEEGNNKINYDNERRPFFENHYKKLLNGSEFQSGVNQ